MTGPEHLIAWAESDRALYLALCDLGRNLYWSAGHVLAMESIGQMRERLNG